MAAKSAPKVAIGGYLGASKTHGSFMGFVTLMGEISRNIVIGIDRKSQSERNGSGTIATWRLFGILEFGNPNNKLFNVIPAPIPPRPAITKYARSQRRDITRRMATIAKRVNKLGPAGVLSLYLKEAAHIVKGIQSVILNNNERPTGPMQSKAKGHSEPLYHRLTYHDAWKYFLTKPSIDKNGELHAVRADKALRRVKIGTSEGFSTVSGRGSFWRNLR